jgi:hypothetical protein
MVLTIAVLDERVMFSEEIVGAGMMSVREEVISQQQKFMMDGVASGVVATRERTEHPALRRPAWGDMLNTHTWAQRHRQIPLCCNAR